MIDVNRLMCIKSDCYRYRAELRVVAANIGPDSYVETHLRLTAKYLGFASRVLAKAVLEASAEDRA